MDRTIRSSKTPLTHLNKLPKKPWRSKCKEAVEKRFPNRKQREKKKTTPKSPIRFKITNMQHNIGKQ
jgi:hypothetical protein